MANDTFERWRDAEPVALAERLAARLRTLPSPRLAISGGSAARLVGPLREALGDRWQQLRLTWADERCVPLADAASNRGALYRAGALRKDAPPKVELPLFQDGETPQGAAERVRRHFQEHFDGGLDMAILGMGGDGHTASLFPGRDWAAGPICFVVKDSPKPPSTRITLSRPVLAAAVSVIYAVGEGKHAALRRTLDGDASLPLSGTTGVLISDLP